MMKKYRFAIIVLSLLVVLMTAGVAADSNVNGGWTSDKAKIVLPTVANEVKNSPLSQDELSAVLPEYWTLVYRSRTRMDYVGDVDEITKTASYSGTTRFRMSGPYGTDFDLYVWANGRWYSSLRTNSEEAFSFYLRRGSRYTIHVESDGGTGRAEIAVHRWSY